MWCPVEVNLDWTVEVSSFLMGFSKIIMLHKCCFGLNKFWKIILETMFPKKSCVVTLLYVIIYEKCIMFNICIWGNA